MKHNIKTKKSPVKIVITAITIFLCATFILFMAGGIAEIHESMTGYNNYDEEDLLYALSREDYASLLYQIQWDTREDSRKSDDYLECEAICNYYKAASLYRAYTEYGDKENARKQLELMQEYESQITTYHSHVNKINAIFEAEMD